MKKIKKKTIILILITFLSTYIVYSTTTPPQRYVIYGRAMLDGDLLKSEHNAIVSLKINDQEIANYTIGSNKNLGCCYFALIVPTDPKEIEYNGKEAKIYINDIPINEGPLRIGNAGTVEYTEISANSRPPEE